jgi:hypothetical protein
MHGLQSDRFLKRFNGKRTERHEPGPSQTKEVHQNIDVEPIEETERPGNGESSVKETGQRVAENHLQVESHPDSSVPVLDPKTDPGHSNKPD